MSRSLLRPRFARGRFRVARRALIAALVAALLVSACSADDSGSPAEPGTLPTATTTPSLDPEAAAEAALLTLDDLPPGWRELTVEGPELLDAVCPDVAASITDLEAASLVGRGSAAARAPELDLPSIRHEVFVLDGGASVEHFDLVSSAEVALCGAAGALDQADFEGSGLREVDPGSLGDEATSRVATFEFTDAGVTIGGRFERVTYRVGPIVGVVLLTSSPTFPISPDDRSTILAAAASRASDALEP